MNTCQRLRWLRLNCFCVVIGLILAWAATAQAHKVTVFAWVEGDTVHTESKFSGGKHVKEGKIEVFDQNDKKLLEGQTDEQGFFAFPKPAAQELKVVLTAGMGHSNHWMVTAEELGTAEPAPEAPPAADPATPEVSTTIAPSAVKTSASPGLDAAAMEKLINRALDHKLAPIKAQLAEQSFGLRDLVAGFGYILGLMGLAAYLHYRKQTRQTTDLSKP